MATKKSTAAHVNTDGALVLPNQMPQSRGKVPAKKAVTKSTVIKSAKTGEFVSKQYADTHPTTTFKQTVTKPAAPSPSKAKPVAEKKVKPAKELTVKQLVSVLNEPQNAKAKKAIIEHVKQVSAEAKAFIDRPSRSAASKKTSPAMKKVDKALNVKNSQPPDIKKAVDGFVQDVMVTHSDAQINKLVGKAKSNTKPTIVRASASRAEVRQSAVADAREIFK